VIAAAAYRSFWQAYTGAIPVDSDDPLLRHPVSVALLRLSRIAGWAKRADGHVELSPSGYDYYHDVERWVTYHLIEPLWEEMMREHTEELDTPRQTPGAALITIGARS
jgi:oxygen-independent coproporphyrinogen-3 oxidase